MTLGVVTMLQVTEIYSSVQGESIYAGWPCVFVRLAGCPLRCRWCDTVYSFKSAPEKSIEVIADEVCRSGVPMVELTGGEPLAQNEAPQLLQTFVDKGLKVLLETSGSESIEKVPSDVHIIMDLKCPDSGMSEKNNWDNLKYLKKTDEIKFVVASKEDFDWSLQIIQKNALNSICRLAFSPAFGHVKEEALVDWMLASKTNARLNLQIHKYIWSPRKKGV